MLTHIKPVPIFDQNLGFLITSDTSDNIFDLDRDQVIDLFKASGLLLFRGFDVDTESLKWFTELYGTNFMTYVGGAYKRDAINGDNTLMSVVAPKLNLAGPLHGEMYYTKKRPGMIWFYCQTPAVSGGETTVCDGRQYYEALSPATLKLFQTKKLKYIRTFPEQVWKGIYQTDDLNVVRQICQDNDTTFQINDTDQTLITEFVCSGIIQSRCGNYPLFINNILPITAQEAQGRLATLVRFEDDSIIPDEILNELKEITGRLIRGVAWQKFDILMIDNSRFLHGRNSYSGDRQIFVRMCDPAFSLSN